YVQALFAVQKENEINYFITKSNEIKIKRIIPFTDFLSTPTLKVALIGL
ncbi:unnamed protein product, partial [Rotaria sp. Silwood1]